MTELPQYRLVVEQDHDADGPIEWGVVVSVPLTDGYYGHTPKGGADHLDLGTLVEYARADRDKLAAVLSRWARVFHGVEVVRWQPQGYSQSSWGDALVYLATEEERALPLAEQRDALERIIPSLDSWYRGDVYVVSLEKRVIWDRREPEENKLSFMDTWETVEALGGCYLDDTYTAGAVAAEHWLAPEGVDLMTLPVVEIGG